MGQRSATYSILLIFIGLLSFGGFSQITLLHPSDNEILIDTAITYRWHDSTLANYEVQVASDITFATPLSVDTVNGGYQLTKTGYSEGQYYWRARRIGVPDSLFTYTHSFQIIDLDTVASGILWLKADGGITLGAGNEVSSWTDHYGGDQNAVQGAAINRPTWTDNLINGKPALQFDGQDDWLKFDTLFNIRDAFFAFKHNDGVQQFASILGDEVNPNFHGGFTNQMFSTSWAHSNVLTGQVRMNQVNAAFATLLRPTKYSILSVYPTGPVRASTINKDRGWTNRYWDGDYLEIMLYSSPLADTTRSLIENYLAWKYTPYPYLGPDTVVCAHTVNIGFNEDHAYSSITWSTGATGVENITVSQNGVYWVEVNSMGLILRDSIVVDGLVPVPQLNQLVDTTICFGDSILLHETGGTPMGISMTWSHGPTVDSVYVSSESDYWLTFSNAAGCTFNSDTVFVIVDSIDVQSGLGPDDTLCINSSLYFQNSSTGNSPYTYSWSTGSTNNFTLLTVPGPNTISIEVTDVFGCISRDTVQIEVSNSGSPTALFSFSNNCFNDVSVFTDQSTPPGGETIVGYSWDLGDTQSATTQDVTYTYSAFGDYIVVLEVEASNGCFGTYQDTITVYELPTAAFNSNGNCSADTVLFNDQTVPGDGVLTDWFWDFGQSGTLADTSVLQNTGYTYNEYASFPVSLQVQDEFGCMSSTTVSVQIQPSPIAAFSVADGCQDASIAITNSSSVAVPGFIIGRTWDFGDGTTSGSSNPNKDYAAPGTYTIQLVVNTNHGCTDTVQQSITVHPIPVPLFAVTNACVGTVAVLDNLSSISVGTIDSTRWIIDVFDTISGDPQYFQFDTEGDHFVKLTAYSEQGCFKDTIQIVPVGPEVIANFNSFTGNSVIAGTPIIFQNTSVGANSYFWNFGDSNTSALTNGENTYDTNLLGSSVTVTLDATNSYGCTDTISKIFSVGEAELDLRIKKLFVMETNGYLNLAAELVNDGTTRIERTELEVTTSGGDNFLEVYTDTLYSGDSHIYIFTNMPSAIFPDQGDLGAYVCVNGTPYVDPLIPELDLSDNMRCANVESKETLLVGPYPNPTDGNVELGIILPEAATVSLMVLDDRGRMVRSLMDEQAMAAGYHALPSDLSDLANGVYVVRLIESETVINRKLVKK